MQQIQNQEVTSLSNASQRIASKFLALLEKQFPMESVTRQIEVRYPLEFADLLSVHVNHLNRSVKEITGHTTTQVIAKRLLTEAERLLKETTWNVSEIGWCLGFAELPHFINFFKKRTKFTPNKFRRLESVAIEEQTEEVEIENQ